MTEEVAVVKEEGKLQDLKQAGRISVSPTEACRCHISHCMFLGEFVSFLVDQTDGGTSALDLFALV